jgi:hypothetical protein
LLRSKEEKDEYAGVVGVAVVGGGVGVFVVRGGVGGVVRGGGDDT